LLIILATLLTFNTISMSREFEDNAEQIKQRIDIYKENLKFINSFYLPLVSAMIALLIVNDTMPQNLRLGWIAVGAMSISLLTLLKLDIMQTINTLIRNL
jgi:hypothetical protein